MANNYFLRTDVLPEEIPALFSNRSLYTNNLLSEKEVKAHIRENTNSKGGTDFLDTMCQYGYNTSKPLYYTTKVSDHKIRKMSLLHPGAQLRALFFILKYEDDILDNMNSSFSFRMPLKRNENTIKKTQKRQNELSELLSSFDLECGVSSEESIVKFRHYFSYAWAPKFSSLASNSKFKEIQLKYKVSKKIDIQNFFPSVYTHSLTWALLGSKSVAKMAKKSMLDKSFEGAIDRLMQSINFKETNGIVVGPEFSRVIVELLLSKVDTIVEKNLLEKHNKVNNIDYSIIRYVDDIFIFSNDSQLNNVIENEFESCLRTFNLSINDSKIKDFSDTTSILYSRVTEIKKIILDFKNSRVLEFLESKEKEKEKEKESPSNFEMSIKEYLGSTYLWELLFDNINNLIDSESDRKDILVNYSLSSLSRLIQFSKINPKQALTILTGVTSLLKTNFCFKSARYYIIVVSSILKKADQIIKKELSNNVLLFEENLKPNEELKGILKFIFQHICSVLSTDWFDVSEGYEVITLLDFFKKYDLYIPSHILQKFLKQDDILNDYFVLTSITNYVYDSKNHNILKEYTAVHKSICSVLVNKLFQYKQEGIAAQENGNFFYLLNDFYYFPGKNDIFRPLLQQNFSNEITSLQGKRKPSILSRHSYYQWGKSFDYFLEQVLRKKIISSASHFDGLASV
ncbi:Reverse transcriptase (RNA-dependent DNA polymerase) [Fructobacillus sp. EFB-N1]|uniref:reverse transcriptase domain-containing protein n=1 Tax=Fructobacillus sp. EFB-N1 TaxID=1658766 RepID=UPI00064DC0B4|nr:reverse transcriptase domain-containing protein [Fructobacillus sp. EFB-N1]KMK53658.1 Reverse transcriptase (RNA-dependent DNA polymerase) [Fructobacillus sp. EFB-N1]